ncbi:MAG: hypothetical protein II073_04405 [Lachnospiraceae bacterium]|nr:hypothetical protein [Lachnospiraceae bacterium]
MKKWNNPELLTLSLEETAYGNKYATNYDEVRVDQNGRYWYSYSAGADVPTPSAEVIKVD